MQEIQIKSKSSLAKHTPVLFFIIFTGMILASCSSKEGESKEIGNEITNTVPNSDVSKITDESEIRFDEDSHDFKEIKKGDKVTHIFKFTNIGKKPLIISEVRPSCGCTTPEYTKDAVAPGKKGFVTVTFDSSNFEGAVFKTVAVSGNFEAKSINFKADIKK